MKKKSMKVLIIKTSSLGDIIHTLPAITDAIKNVPNLMLDWVVEESFAEVPSWHPGVRKVIPVGIRSWRKNLKKAQQSGAIASFLKNLRSEKYDLVIDAQGLIKSALIALCSRGKTAGFNFNSVREPLAALCYSKRYEVAIKQHAVFRLRTLFAQALQYQTPTDAPDFAIQTSAGWVKHERRLGQAPALAGAGQTIERDPNQHVMFIHGTTSTKKMWAETNWIELAKLVNLAGFKVLLPWGNEEEKTRANYIAQNASNAAVLPKTTLTELKNSIAAAKAVVAVDTGLGHLAAALDKPTISLYGATDPMLIGTLGSASTRLIAPKITSSQTVLVQVSVNQVWEHLSKFLRANEKL